MSKKIEFENPNIIIEKATPEISTKNQKTHAFRYHNDPVFKQNYLNKYVHTKITCCVCGGLYTASNKSKHLNTNKHMLRSLNPDYKDKKCNEIIQTLTKTTQKVDKTASIEVKKDV